MSGSFARDKGQRAERAVVHLLQPIIDEEYERAGKESPMLERNQMQSHKGGYDIVGLDWLALEVKHQENLQVNQWWKQCMDQTKDGQESVLIYKQNRTKWRVVMFGMIPVGGDWIDWPRVPVEISVEAFLICFRQRIRRELEVSI